MEQSSKSPTSSGEQLAQPAGPPAASVGMRKSTRKPGNAASAAAAAAGGAAAAAVAPNPLALAARKKPRKRPARKAQGGNRPNVPTGPVTLFFLCDLVVFVWSCQRLKEKKDSLAETQQIAVDMSKLDLTALKRYKKHYKLRTRHKASRKADLVLAVSRHFAAQSVDEVDTIERFVYALKTRT